MSAAVENFQLLEAGLIRPPQLSLRSVRHPGDSVGSVDVQLCSEPLGISTESMKCLTSSLVNLLECMV